MKTDRHCNARLLCLLLTPLLLLNLHTVKAQSKRNKLTSVTISNLQVEYTGTPIGIDVEKPRFSWQMNAEGKRGYSQTGYQIQVKDAKGALVLGFKKSNR